FRSHIYTAFTVMDRESDFICFTTKLAHFAPGGEVRGRNFDLAKRQPFEGWTYFASGDIVLISTTERLVYYALKRGPRGGLVINTFYFTGDTVRSSQRIQATHPRYWPLCRRGATDIYMATSLAHCPDPLHWPVLKGFVDEQHQFYLFGPDHVFVFAEEVYHKPNQSVPV